MKLSYYEVSAFTTNPFGGNPAGVCVLDAWLPDATLLGIAANNNLAETAFIVPRGTDFELRWFTPTVEIDLCGHATLAAASVLFQERSTCGDRIHFHSRSGLLAVARDRDLLTLDFPARPPAPSAAPEALPRSKPSIASASSSPRREGIVTSSPVFLPRGRAWMKTR